MQSQIIKANGAQIPIQPKNGSDFQLNELKSIVDGYIEIVRCLNGHIIVCDEEGQLKQKPYNLKASALCGQVIVGDVLLCHSNEVK